MLFSRIDEIEFLEIDDAETIRPENHQDNGSTPPVKPQPSPSHPPLEDALVASATPPPRQRIESGNDALQAQEGDLPDVRLIGIDYMLYVVYQYWVHQNSQDHLDGVIAEESKCQAR